MNVRKRPTLTEDRSRARSLQPPTALEQQPIEHLLEVVTDPTRRQLLDTLRSDTSGRLIESLLDADQDDRARADQRASLYHSHLPKLEDVGLVEIDWNRRLIYYRPDARLEVLLDTVSALSSEWEAVERPATTRIDAVLAEGRRLLQAAEREVSSRLAHRRR